MALKLVLLSLGSLPAISAETILGAYIFHRHGDRTDKSHPPANLTSLGTDQVFSSGAYYRRRYVASDAGSPIFGLSHDIAINSQMTITSTVDVVLQSSAQVFTQGLYPPAGTLSSQKLANGSMVEPPLGGYQYIPVNIVSSPSSTSNSENSGWLQGSSGCGNVSLPSSPLSRKAQPRRIYRALVSSNNYFSSLEYLTTLNETHSFYQSLVPVINQTFSSSQATFKNGYTIFDLIHVATIHNATIPSSSILTNDTLNKLFWLANTHEWGLAYNETESIRAIAGSTLAAEILQQLNATLTGKSKVPLGVQFGAYGSFMSFFGLAQLQKISTDFTGIVDYASSMVFELVTSSDNVTASTYPGTADISVRFLFANGSAADNAPVAYPLFGQSETLVPWNTFVNEMNKFAIGDTATWCTACGNSTGVCAAYAQSSGSGSSGGSSTTEASTSGNSISLPVAGVIGALVTLVVILGIEALVYAVAGLKLVKKSTLAGASSAGGSAAAAKA